MENNDCKVCKQLMKEKKHKEVWWKVGCIVFFAIALILGILYFSSDKITKSVNVELIETTIENNGNNGSIIIGGEDNNIGTSITGTISGRNDTPIICITLIVSVSILVVGGVLIADNIKRNR